MPGILASSLQGRSSARPKASMTAQDLADELTRIALGGSGDAAVTVTADSAGRETTVATCLRILGESVGQLPLTIQYRDANGKTVVVDDHPIAQLLGKRGKPNPWQSPFDFRETTSRQTALRGNGVAIKTVVNGEVRELLPVHPNRVTIEQDERWRIKYKIRIDNGGTEILGPEDVFHLRGPSDDGYKGLDLVSHFRVAIGLAIAQDKDTSRMFSHGARLGLVLQTDETLSDEVFNRIKSSFEDVYSGVDNSHKTPILEGGLKAEQVSMTAQEAQALEARKLQRSILAGIWRIPPHMVGDLDKATFSNIENLARQFVDHALNPWVDRWEQALAMQLMTDQQRLDGLQVKLDPRVLLRADHKTRAAFYQSGISGRWLNPNEVRQKEDMDPYDGGNEFLNPAIEPTPDSSGSDDNVEEDRSD